MLSCTCIIILQASLNYMPHHVLLFNILSGTTIQLGILNKKGNTLLFGYTACCVWIQSPLTGAPSRLLNYILYKCFKVFHLQSCLLYNVRVGLWLVVFPVSQNFPCYSELIFLKKSNEREEWKEQKKQKKLQRFRSLILGHFFFLALSRLQASNQGEERSIRKPAYLQMVFLTYPTLYYPKRTGMLKSKWRKTGSN